MPNGGWWVNPFKFDSSGMQGKVKMDWSDNVGEVIKAILNIEGEEFDNV
jgi:hypothetical protein